MNARLFYGLANQQEAVMIARRICDVIGGGANGTALELLIETAQQETKLGSYRDDYPYSHGVGLCQFDEIAFRDVQQRTNKHVREKVEKHFGVTLRLVQHRDLAYSPFLSLLWCRLFYLLRPEPIPATLKERAEYWKLHYNTVRGKGTTLEYIVSAKALTVTI